MKNVNPLYALKITAAIIGFTIVALPIVARLEGKRLDVHIFLPMVFIFSSLCVIHSVFKSIDRRLSDIEQRMNQKDR
jgi:predicted membrane protein